MRKVFAEYYAEVIFALQILENNFFLIFLFEKHHFETQSTRNYFLLCMTFQCFKMARQFLFSFKSAARTIYR